MTTTAQKTITTTRRRIASHPLTSLCRQNDNKRPNLQVRQQQQQRPPPRRMWWTSKQVGTAFYTICRNLSLNLSHISDLLDIEDLPAPTPQLCPLACHCTPLGAVNCSGLQLSQLPAELPENLVSLDLSSNRLAEIDLNVLVQFKELRELNLSHNQIHQIQKLVCRLSEWLFPSKCPNSNPSLPSI